MMRARWLHVLGIVVLLVVGVRLMSLPLLHAWGEDAYRRDAFATSIDRWRPLLPANVVTPDVAHFALGAANFGRGDYDAARANFTSALRTAPSERRCRARRNLVLTLEAHAATLGGAQDELRQERLLRRALGYIDAAPSCMRRTAPDGRSAQELRAARSRIMGRTPGTPAAGDRPAVRDSTEGNPYGTPSATAQQQLQQLQREAASYRGVAAQLARNRGVTPHAPDDPKW